MVPLRDGSVAAAAGDAAAAVVATTIPATCDRKSARDCCCCSGNAQSAIVEQDVVDADEVAVRVSDAVDDGDEKASHEDTKIVVVAKRIDGLSFMTYY